MCFRTAWHVQAPSVQTPAFGYSVAGINKKSREDFAMKSLAYATLFALALTRAPGKARGRYERDLLHIRC
jgi:hypothetical protein